MGRHVHKEAQRVQDAFVAVMKANRKRLFVSCWHSSNHESAALWKFYSSQEESKRETEFAVAIRVELERFRLWLQNQSLVFSLGQINYVDFKDQNLEIDHKDLVAFASYKRMSFDHEKEIRAIHLLSSGDPPRNIFLHFPLNELNAHVFVDPTADGKAVAAVKGIVNGIYSDPAQPIKVIHSDLYTDPMY
jgi:hypothetical protein